MTDLESTVAEDDRRGDGREEGEDGLNPLQIRFVELLASGSTMRGAATELGRSERTLRRWKVESGVKAALRERLAESLSRARAVLSAGAGEASSALVGMATGTVAADSARVSACRTILENATKLGELEDLESRLAELERQLAFDGRQGGQS